MNIGIVGGNGRLGQELIEAIAKRKGINVGAVITSENIDRVLDSAEACNLYVDTTNANALSKNFEVYNRLRKPVIIATTGFDEATREKFQRLSEETPILFGDNFSLEVFQFIEIIKYATRVLGSSLDVEVIEIHNKLKKDNPSGTARRIAETIANEREGWERDIPIHSLRMGNIIGEHKVLFANAENVQLELSHKQFSRQGYAEGIIQASIWLLHKERGLYDIADVFNEVLGR